ncbi:hypothetical protein [Zoogloea sp.]|uniref:hypothetical protein n=1 Tax=Zoogloea sp. TaxID=49181 RepID=UPI001D95390B|nr:hypothetical protein [Zoogloea sp.]MBK6655018.1 hypothetical protein [Zoogloea sp.]
MAPSAADDMYGRDGRTAVLDLHGTSLLFALNEKKFLLEKQKLCQAPTTRKIKDLALEDRVSCTETWRPVAALHQR